MSKRRMVGYLKVVLPILLLDEKRCEITSILKPHPPQSSYPISGSSDCVTFEACSFHGRVICHFFPRVLLR